MQTFDIDASVQVMTTRLWCTRTMTGMSRIWVLVDGSLCRWIPVLIDGYLLSFGDFSTPAHPFITHYRLLGIDNIREWTGLEFGKS